MKEIKEDVNKGREILCSWIRRFNRVKMSILPQLIYRFNIYPIKIPASFLQTYIRLCQNLYEKAKELIAKIILKNENKVRRISLLFSGIDDIHIKYFLIVLEVPESLFMFFSVVKFE